MARSAVASSPLRLGSKVLLPLPTSAGFPSTGCSALTATSSVSSSIFFPSVISSFSYLLSLTSSSRGPSFTFSPSLRSPSSFSSIFTSPTSCASISICCETAATLAVPSPSFVVETRNPGFLSSPAGLWQRVCKEKKNSSDLLFARRLRGGTMAASGNSGSAATPSPSVQKSEEEWRTVLSPEQFRILRQKGTEWAGTGKYDKFNQNGLYECAGCGTPLYKSTTKFNSGCGWPAFYEGLPGAITETVDADGRRIEITCTACGGHLGHTFKGEGYATPTNERHCVNSISLKFTPANK